MKYLVDRYVALELWLEIIALELLLEILTLELEVLFDQFFTQTRVIMTFQSAVSRGFSHAVSPPWVVKLEMLFLAKTFAISNCWSHRFSLKAL